MKRWVFLTGLFATLAQAGVFEENHPLVQEGIDAYQKGDFQTALRKFEAAQKKLPDSPRVEFNRGNALYKLGRFDDAFKAFEKVQSMDASMLEGRDFYNMGNSLISLGKEKEALSAYRKALLKNPNDEAARHNLEWLLRKNSADAGSDGGTDGGSDGGADGGSDGGSDAGVDGGSDGGTDGGPDGGTQSGADGGRSDGGASDAGADGGSDVSPTEKESLDAGVSPQDLSKQDVEKILDSMRKKEKGLQFWRFQKKNSRRSEKDW